MRRAALLSFVVTTACSSSPAGPSTSSPPPAVVVTRTLPSIGISNEIGGFTPLVVAAVDAAGNYIIDSMAVSFTDSAVLALTRSTAGAVLEVSLAGQWYYANGGEVYGFDSTTVDQLVGDTVHRAISYQWSRPGFVTVCSNGSCSTPPQLATRLSLTGFGSYPSNWLVMVAPF